VFSKLRKRSYYHCREFHVTHGQCSYISNIEKEHIPPSPVPADEINFLEGAGINKQHCALRHGLPGQPPVHYATTMFPKPPQLFRGKGVTDDPASETYILGCEFFNSHAISLINGNNRLFGVGWFDAHRDLRPDMNLRKPAELFSMKAFVCTPE